MSLTKVFGRSSENRF